MGCLPSCYAINETEQLVVQTFTTQFVLDGPTVTVIAPFRTCTKRSASILNDKQFIHIKNAKTGEFREERGPGLKFLQPYEQVTEHGVQEAISLRPDEYVKLVNRKTGAIRVERGEKLVWPQPFEEVIENGVQKVIVIDETHACLVRDITTGNLALIIEQQMFVPNNVQEVVVRSMEKVVLKEFEVMVLVDPRGNFVFKHGWIPSEASFFLPPFHTILELNWTKTSARKALVEGQQESRQKLIDEERLNRIDVRHRYMTYAFVARTQDNVEIVLDIVFGWAITNVEKMINKSKDITNDICLKARSEIIEKVARMTFRGFMQEVNSVVANAVLDGDKEFFQTRGIELSSIQVEGFSCKHPQTEKVLQETVQETTNKMNRILKQETANEVIRVEMEGKIREEELKKRVLEIQYEHEQLIAKTDGEAMSARIKCFIESLGKDIGMEDKLALFALLEKKESVKDLASGSGVTLFCAPQDVNLNLSAFNTFSGNVMQKKVKN